MADELDVCVISFVEGDSGEKMCSDLFPDGFFPMVAPVIMVDRETGVPVGDDLDEYPSDKFGTLMCETVKLDAKPPEPEIIDDDRSVYSQGQKELILNIASDEAMGKGFRYLRYVYVRNGGIYFRGSKGLNKWSYLADIVKSGPYMIIKEIEGSSDDMKLKTALALSCAKWVNNYNLDHARNCGLCLYYGAVEEDDCGSYRWNIIACKESDCPLKNAYGSCYKDGSPYKDYIDSGDKSRMLDALLGLYDEIVGDELEFAN